MKVRVFQPIVPEYRVALFEGLGRRYGNALEIWAAKGAGMDCSCPLVGVRYDYNHSFFRIGPFVWQRGASVAGLHQGDVVVVSGDIHQLSTIWVALCAKIRRIRVVWWGHHRSATSKGWRVYIRLYIAKLLSDSFLCYTRTGIRYLEGCGFRRNQIFATGNTIDQVPIQAAIKSCNRLNLISTSFGRPYFLCVGVLRAKVHLELFLRAMTSKQLSEVGLVVIGDGEMKMSWQALAEDLGISSRIKWLPGTRDQKVMAPWFLGAKAFVYPGAIGLSILHSFSYGLPVVTHGNVNHHGPEFEVMEDGKTGLCFEEMNIEDIVAKTEALLKNESRRRVMAEYCQTLVRERYSMDKMISNYCEAIDKTATVR